MLSLSSLFAASAFSGEVQAIVDALFNALNPPANPLDPGMYWLFWFFGGLSVGFFALTVVFFFIKLLRSQSRIGWLGVSASLLASVWCLRFAVGLYGILVSPEAGLTVVEEIFNSFSHALQTFSMDEDYTEYIINGRTMFAELCGADTFPVAAYGFYASVLNLLAPVAGGALLFEMLASIFPRLRLWAARWNVFSEKIYFSELNEQSLALMKSLQESGEKKRATYIFTDAYEDKEDEQRSERLAEAKQMGAVCLPDDIAHIVKRGWGKRTYFLIDESEVSNLQTLVDLADESNRYCLKKADVYLFCRGDLYTRIERQVFAALHESPRWDKDKDPLITPVHSYRNLVSNLLVELPLYEPLVAKEGQKSLNVTILGNGAIGTELFLAVYWMGQILDHKLNINVVSKDSFKEFWEKIDYINPEIRKTVEVDRPNRLSRKIWTSSAGGGSYSQAAKEAADRQEFLRWDIDGSNQSNDPYATVSYLPSDVKSGSFWQMGDKDYAKLLSTDYFIVSLGSDEDNVAIAEKIRQRVGEHHVQNKDARQKTVIAYVVYDSDLCDTLNRKKKHYSYDPAAPDIYMHAFGSRREVFSYKNIMMTEHQLLAEGAGAGYAASQAKAASEKAHRYEESDLKNDNNNRDYSYWANLGRAMHLKYKAFSSDMIATSVFMDSDETSRLHRNAVEDQCRRYKYYMIAPAMNKGENSPLKDKISDLAWLEHRRWCAFTRVRGFRRTEFHGNYKDVTGSHKHMSLKLHPCLRESYRYSKRKGDDALGALEETLERTFKYNDRPHCAFGEFITEDEAVALLGGDPKKAKKILYAKGKKALGNTFVYEEENTVLFFREEICRAAEKKRKKSAK